MPRVTFSQSLVQQPVVRIRQPANGLIQSQRSSSNVYDSGMEDTIISRKPDGSYRATVNGRTIATGETQNEAGWNALQKRPNAAIVAQRVRDLGEKHEDQFRRLYPQKPE